MKIEWFIQRNVLAQTLCESRNVGMCWRARFEVFLYLLVIHKKMFRLPFDENI